MNSRLKLATRTSKSTVYRAGQSAVRRGKLQGVRAQEKWTDTSAPSNAATRREEGGVICKVVNLLKTDNAFWSFSEAPRKWMMSWLNSVMMTLRWNAANVAK